MPRLISPQAHGVNKFINPRGLTPFKPFLGKGSFLVPVLCWEKAHRDVRNWIAMLNHHNRFRPNNKILYVTLVRIKDDFPCTLNGDWIEQDDEYVPWKQVPADMKEEQVHWLDDSKRSRQATGSFPQLILGATVPPCCILWTKNARLLFRGDKKRRAREFAHRAQEVSGCVEDA